MSRIHEALKKAELERAAAPPAGAGGALLDPQASLPSVAQNGGTAATTGEAKPTGPAEQERHFQFSDLQERHPAHHHWNPDPNSDVFSAKQSSHGAEQFRTLRSRLYQLRGSQALKTVLITSSMTGEGKTFVTANLARALARQAERRVLMIDADLRRSRLHVLFGAPSSPGLSDYLRGSCDEASVIQRSQVADNLCFIPGGSQVSDPSELLSNGRLKTLLERVKPAFDWILIDSPPCLPVADPGVIAHSCDGVLLVVRAEYTPAEVILKSRRELKDTNILGVVLNAVAEGATAYNSYYAYGYQGNEAQART